MTGELFPDIDRPAKKQKTPASGLLPFPATYDAAPIQAGSVAGTIFGNTCKKCNVLNGECGCFQAGNERQTR